MRSTRGRGNRARHTTWLVVLALLGSLAPRTAAAGGFELTPAGGRANGRAGAIRAGGDSPMSMFYNPAILARLPRYNAMSATHLHFSDRCMTRVEVVEMGDNRMPGEPLPKVCNEAGTGVVPELAASAMLADGFTLALGLYAPPAGLRSSRYGEPETVTIEEDGMRVPSPLRYLSIESDLLQVFPSIGLAYEPHPAIRLGFTFGVGITNIAFANAAYSEVDLNPDEPGNEVSADTRNSANGRDKFVPRILAGVHVTPVPDTPFEMGLTFQWTDDIGIDDATLDIQAFNFDPPALANLGIAGSVPGVRIDVPQPMQLGFGLRWFQPLDEPVEGGNGDRLSTEAFDIEANLVLTFGKQVDRFRVDLPDDATLDAVGADPVDLPNEVILEHQWRTQISGYFGGDWNVVPGLFALRTGLSVDSDGVSTGFEQLDFTPFRRVGFHFGATIRAADTIDFSVTYAHIFQPDRRIRVDDAQLRRSVGGDATEDDAEIINAGTITSSYNVLALEVGGHF